MKILFLNQFYWPDTAATGQLLSDLTEQLAATGNTVSVICGSANYGGVTTAPPPKVRIYRLKTSTFSRKAAGRMGSYLSFLFGAFWQSLRVSAPDVMVTLTTPPLLSLIGLMIQKLRGARHVIWEMDVYPDVAVDLGILERDSVAAKVFGWLADLPRRHADCIIVLGECMRTRLLAHGLPDNKIVVAENWAGRNEFAGPARREAPMVVTDAISILYSGNFGLAHDAKTICAAMVELDKRPTGGSSYRFTFAGSGSGNGWLQNVCREHKLQNVLFQGYCERQELDARLVAGHIGLVTQKNECLGSAVPSKTYGIMAAGRPILFIGPKESTPARIIEQYNCGWHIECDDVTGLIDLLDCLSAQPELIVAAGARAYRAFISKYQRSIGVARILSILNNEQAVECPASAHMASQLENSNH